MEENNGLLEGGMNNTDNEENAGGQPQTAEDTGILEQVVTEDGEAVSGTGETAEAAVEEATVTEETAAEETGAEAAAEETAVTEETAADEAAVEEAVAEEAAMESGDSPEAAAEPAEESGKAEGEEKPKKPRKRKAKNTDGQAGEEAEPQLPKPECPEAAIEAVLFATGNSVTVEQLADILNMTKDEVRDAIAVLKERYNSEDRGITITELEDAVQLGTKGEYYEYLMKLAKHPKHYSLSDTVIETLSIIAYKQPVTRGEIEKIRGVSCDHAINKLLEYDLIEEVGRLDAPGKPLLFGTTEQFLRSFGVKSIGELPTVSPEMVEDFKVQAEAEAAEDLALEKVQVDV